MARKGFLAPEISPERGCAGQLWQNFVEEGKTVAIVASAAISSGDLVQVGDVFAVALTDIPQGEKQATA